MHSILGCNHPTFALPWRTLLPYLVALHLLHLGSAQFNVVAPSRVVTANVGQDVVLRCHLSPCKDAWRSDIRWIQQRSSGFVHHYRDGEDLEQMAEYKGRTELLRDGLSDGNLDLRISAVRSSDSGSYSCAVQDGDNRGEAVVNLEVSDPFYQIILSWTVALAVVIALLFGSLVIIALLYRNQAAQSRELKVKDAELEELTAILERRDAMLEKQVVKLEEKTDEVANWNSVLKKDCEEMDNNVADLKKLATRLEKHCDEMGTRDAKLEKLTAKVGQQAKELEKQNSQFQRHFQNMHFIATKQKKLVTKLEEHCEQTERRNAKFKLQAVKLGQPAKVSENRNLELKEIGEQMAQRTEAAVVDIEEPEETSEESD